MNVRKNITTLRHDIPEHVAIVAVSKKKSAELVMQAHDAGQRDFGENYVQELLDKQAILPNDIQWHFIGHLQSNKVKQIVPFVHLIHGVDSLKLLEEIDRQASKVNRTVSCLLQLHIAKEETKFGLSFDECRQLLSSEKVKQLSHVHIRGFMAMASNTQDEAQVRSEFRSVKEFRDSLADRDKFHILSYGMSGDYRIAIEEGANMVRIGSLIFGER